jgi:hypothetical protein
VLPAFIGFAIMLVSGLILLFVLGDQIGLSRFGYPAFSIPLLALLVLIGFGICRLASLGLRSTDASSN